MAEDEQSPELEDLLWVRDQLRVTIPELSPKERISALEAYRKLVGSISALKKGLNVGEQGAAGKLEALVGDAPSGGTEGEWDDPVEVTRHTVPDDE